ncbi:MAG: dihydrolipoamide acetyltransferase family protein [Candidatus Bipolaricaulia bacterium]
MATEFRLPDVGEGIAEGEIVKWLVEEGQTIEEDQPLVEVMTDKATVEIPSPVGGTVLKRIGDEGDIVEVGSVLVVIGEPGEESAPTPDGKAEAESEAKTAATTATQAEAPTPAPAKKPGRILATPATRKLARELGIDIAQVEGTGPGGRVTDDDVRRFAEAGAKEPVAVSTEAVSVTAEEQEERIHFRGLRRRIAEHMVRSIYTAPHVTHIDEVDMTELVALRTRVKPLAESRGVKLTYLPFIIKALIPAMKAYPYVNASLDEENDEIVVKRYYNIGIATATDDGLIVPVIKASDHKSILEIAAEIERLAEKIREGKVDLEDIRGGTFTITNVGSVGGVVSTPIINYPEVAILGVHRIEKRPVVKDKEIQVRDMMYLALSFDHRVLDGAIAAAFINRVVSHLEDPGLLMMEMA